MSSLVLLYAALWGGELPALSGTTCQVEVQLVSVSPDGVLTQSRLFSFAPQVWSKQQKIVLRRDEQGQPTSWLELRSRDRTAADEALTPTTDQRGMVHPFFYEPF